VSRTETTGSAQVGSAGAEAPVRVLSDGGDAGSGAAGRTGGEQTVDGTSGAAQAGAPGLFAPVRVLSDTGSPAGEPDAWDSAGDLVGLIADADGSQGATPIGSQAPGDAPEGVRRLADSGGTAPGTRPALQLVTGGDGPITGVQDTGAGGLQTLGVQAGSLPLTGFALPALVALGMWLLSSGLALRLVPGGKRR
jgi:hypothetical protein